MYDNFNEMKKIKNVEIHIIYIKANELELKAKKKFNAFNLCWNLQSRGWIILDNTHIAYCIFMKRIEHNAYILLNERAQKKRRKKTVFVIIICFVIDNECRV